MTNREKVLKALEYHKETTVCNGCPYAGDEDTAQGFCPVYDDAIALLREQEPVKPVKEQIYSFIFGWVCGACGFPLLGDKCMYCSRCGRKVKWDD